MVKTQVIMGSTREGRFVEQPANCIFEKLKKKKDVNAELKRR
jgi:NAD(P)H-dependent FMN reductase